MSFRSGKDSDAKPLLMRLPEERGDDELYLLDRAQIKALLSLATSIGWRTRHKAFPTYINTQDKLEAFADETALDLMTPIDFCSQLASCEAELAAILENLIASNTSIQQAIKDMLLADQNFITNIFSAKPLPVETLNPDTDDLGVLWAQCVGIVEYTHNAINDLFDILEVQSNNVELMSNLRLIPGLSTMMDAVGASQFILFVDYLASTLNEQYEANWEETPPSGTKWVIACKIFCLCKDDKIITVDRIFQAIISLLSAYTTVSWDNVQEVVETVIGVNDNSDVMVYGTFFMMWGTAKLASVFGLQTLTSTALKTIIALHDEPSNDWEVYCLDCPPEADPNCQDFTISQHDWYPSISNGSPSSSFGEYHPGEGLACKVEGPGYGVFFWAKENVEDKSISSATVYLNENITNLVLGRIGNSGATMTNPENPRKVVRFDATTHPSFFPTSLEVFQLYLTTTNNYSTDTLRVEMICYEYVE